MVIVGLSAWVLEPVRVASDSMSPTLQAGDHVVVEKLSHHWREPRIGDLVVFHEPTSDALTIKRIVGLGGDSVAIEDGQLVVNGSAVEEPRVDRSRIDSVYFGPVRVPDGFVFVMGDNRGASIDSRAYGPIRSRDLVGRAVLWF